MKALSPAIAAVLIALTAAACATTSSGGPSGPTNVEVGGETRIRAQAYK